MTRKEDLENHIRKSYALIREYEEILRESDNPKKKARARQIMDEQWALIARYAGEYHRLADETPDDVARILAGLPDLFSSCTTPSQQEAKSHTPPGTTRTKYTIHIDHAEGVAIGDGARVERREPAQDEAACRTRGIIPLE
jgi:hypothetical protein